MYHDKAVMSSTKCPWLPQANFKLASWNAFYPNIHCVLHLIEGSMFDSHLNFRNWWKYLKQKLRLIFYIVLFVLLITSPLKESTAFSPFPLFLPKAVHALYISDRALSMFLIKILLHQRLLAKLRSILSAW